MTNLLQKFLLLMWKNSIMMLRRPSRTIFEFIWPLLFIVLIFFFREKAKVSFNEKTEFHSLLLEQLVEEHVCNAWKPVIAMSPKNMVLKSKLENVCGEPDFVINVKDFENKAELDEKIVSDVNFTKETLFAIQFNDSIKDIDEVKNLDLEIILRFPEDFNTNQLWSFKENLYNFQQLTRSNQRFLAVQWLTTSLFIDNEKSVFIEIQAFTNPGYKSDFFYLHHYGLISFVSPLIMMIFLFNYIFLIKTIAFEKENQLKESMNVMGLPGWLQWLTWFLHSLIFNLIIITMMFTILQSLTDTPVFPASNGFILFMFFILFACANITQAFFITTIFPSANVATFAGFIFFVVSIGPYFILLEDSDKKGPSLNTVLVSSLFPLSGLGFGLGLIYKFERIQSGIQLNNIWMKLFSENFCFGHILIMLVLDSIFYMILALYIEKVFPGEYGIPQPWYFPCISSFWLKASAKVHPEDDITSSTALVEPFTETRAVGIQLINLTKSFNGQEVVKNLNLDIYEGHLTVLLGHNGAGKTTILNMITGMLPPTKGTAIVAKNDVTKKGKDVRNSMGLCLQHNVYFEKLTVQDHLLFFSKLKGMNGKEIEPQIKYYLQSLSLEEKKNSFPTTLSGGMKRKLGVAIALCGQSKVVILDEPTAGMDPSARRQVWTLLQQEKEKRTILLTTHFMDEADLLGDRVAIIAAGELQCCGSSFFLKQKYEIGYHLVLDVTPRCKTYKISKLLKNHVQSVKLQSHLGSEIIYNLGNESAKFERMLRDLEGNALNLEIRSFGISAASLEDVFMKLENEKEKSLKEESSNESSTSRASKQYEEFFEEVLYTETQTERLQGVSFIVNQARALVWKRALYTSRTWPWLVIQVLLPFMFILLAVKSEDKKRASYANRGRSTSEPLRLTLQPYDNPVPILAGSKDSIFYQKYLKIVTDSGHDILESPDIKQKVEDLMALHPYEAKYHYFLGANISKLDDPFGYKSITVITAWYHGEPFHAASLSLSLVLNTWYSVRCDDKTITFINHPYVRLEHESEIPQIKRRPIGTKLALHLNLAMALTYGLYILFYIEERVSGHKHLQFSSGVNVVVFWTMALLCDLIVFLTVTTTVLITFVVVQEEPFVTSKEFGCVLLIFASFFVFGFPSLYVLSHLIDTPVIGFIFVVLTSLCAVAVVLMVVMLQNPFTAKAFFTFIWTPFFAFASGLFNIVTLKTTQEFCQPSFCNESSKCCYSAESYYEFNINGISINIAVALLMFFLLFSTLILVGTGGIRRFTNCFGGKKPMPPLDIDSDVQEEAEKIADTSITTLTRSNVLLIRDLTKYYKKFCAVNGISLAVGSGECFGLLGENGAGKTTTFKMITGDISISYGSAWINGYNIKKNLKKVQQSIGYCPQFDALLDNLTPRETFRIIALIRGVPDKYCAALTDRLSDEFNFSKHLDKRIKHLSGGNKRKLSVALALIGDPPIIYLDEPSTGLDPAAKRRLWSSLAKVRDSGKCIILTSQSMEECEALCTRLAVMVKGNFQCLGSSQSLKNKFVQAYSLIIKVKKPVDENKVAAIDNFVTKVFPGAKLSERFEEMLNYELVRGKTSWSQIFGIIEKSKKMLGIEEYSLGQCSLEQVFLSFIH